jgi:hypothetical protein
VSEPKPLTPVARTFLLCREIFQDAATQEYILVGPAVNLRAPQYPLVATVSFFTQMTSLRGTYQLAIELQTEEGDAVFTNKLDPPFEMNDPLQVCTLSFLRVSILVPKPGRYDFVLLANGEAAARYPITAGFPQVAEPPAPD